MKKFSLVSLVVASALAISPAVVNAQTYDFTYSDSNYVLSGVLTATPDGGGIYTVTGVAGTVAQASAPSIKYPLTLVPPYAVPSNHNGDNIYGQDDLIYPGQAPLLTLCPNYGCPFGGLEFAFPAPPPLIGINGGSDIALFANTSVSYGSLESANLGGYAITTSDGAFTLIAVPEGGLTALYLLLAAVTCLGAIFLASRDKLVSCAQIRRF